MKEENLNSKQAIGKIIKSMYVSDSMIEIVFTDESEIDIRLEYTGYAGAIISSDFYYPPKKFE